METAILAPCNFDAEEFKAKARHVCSKQLSEYKNLQMAQAEVIQKIQKEKENHERRLADKERIIADSVSDKDLVAGQYNYDKFQTDIKKHQAAIDASAVAMDALKTIRKKIEQNMSHSKHKASEALATYFSSRTSEINAEADIKVKECLAVIRNFTEACRAVCLDAGINYPNADPRIHPQINDELEIYIKR